MYKLIVFFILNFGALGIGSYLIGNPSENDWYRNANIAPWTPPGWVFGFAWTTIMICFSIFMWRETNQKNFAELKWFYVLYAIQWLLNVLWNPVFFRWHFVGLALVMIIALVILVAYFTYYGYKHSIFSFLLVLPYFVWLVIATTLNAYIYVKN